MIIKNGIIFNTDPFIDGKKLDIKIENSIIKKIAPSIIPKENESIIDAKNLYVIPGLVDIHSHFRVPGYEYKEDFITGSKAAAKGGITTSVAMPNTAPVIDNPTILKSLYEKAKRESSIEILFSSAMTISRNGKDIVNIKENKKAGAIFFTDDGSDINNPFIIFDLTKKAKRYKVLLVVHPEWHSLTNDKFFNKGFLDTIFGKEGQPEEAESIAILVFGLIAGLNKTKVHFTHISTQSSVETIKFLKDKFGSLISCDTTPHHLILTDKDLINPSLDTNKKINPPLRSEKSKKALEEAIIDGTIDLLATDHAPHSEEEKSAPIEKAPFGSTGFETFLPATFTHLVKNRKISIHKWIDLISTNPARVINIDRGKIKKGKLANLVIFNPNENIKIEKIFFQSKSKNSAFIGKIFDGKVYYTISKGEIIYYEKN
ncbi:MAG: dihydroorotase [Brevinematales bacterium]|nr:dihydroorotase [Brevinematales bacterium]